MQMFILKAARGNAFIILLFVLTSEGEHHEMPEILLKKMIVNHIRTQLPNQLF
jgi:hypothetical protein